jgi:O-antigen/teichoic acid export membrane protein
LLSTLQNAIFLILLYSFIANYPSAEKIIFFSLVAQGCVLLPLAVAVPWSMILPLRLDLGNSGRMLAFSSASFLWMFCYTAIDSIDLVAIKTFLPISYVGTYNAAYRIMSYVWMIPQLTITLTGMLIIGFASKGRDDLIKLYATRYSRHGVFGVALITTVVIGMSREIFWVMLKPEYHSGLVPFIILMVSVSERSVDAFLSPIINAYLLLKKTSVVIIMMAVFNVAGDWLTLKLGMGIMGPAIVTACVFLINGLGLTWIAGRRVGSSLGSHMLFALYPILSIPVALVTGIGYRVTMLCALIGILIGLAKKFRVFDVSDMVLYEKIALPFFFKKGLFRFFHIMA